MIQTDNPEVIQEWQAFLGHKRARFEEIDGRRFFINGEGAKEEILPPTPEPMQFETLAGLLGFAKEAKHQAAPEYLHVASYRAVLLVSPENEARQRSVLGRAAFDHPPFVSSLVKDAGWSARPADAIVALLTETEPSEDRDGLLKILGTIRQEEVRVDEDDGVSARVTHQQGIARAAEAKIGPLLTLRTRHVLFPDLRGEEAGAGVPLRCVVRLEGGNPKAPPVVTFRLADPDFRRLVAQDVGDYLKERTELPVLG